MQLKPTTAHVPEHPIVVYIRVSTPKQRDEGYSLDKQRKDAIAEAVEEAQRQGYSVPPPEDVLCDADTGKTCHRAGRQTLWEWVQRGEVKLVIIASIDRMGRNLRDSDELNDHLIAHGVRIVLLKEGVDTTTSTGNPFFQQMTDGVGKQRPAHKKLHLHIEGKLPSMQADESAIPAFVGIASRPWS